MISVDVIFITYNQEQYVAQGIESILAQKVSDKVSVRVIVADDCSPDNTLSIIKSYEERSPFPFVYTNYTHNVGMRNNYKHAFELCIGDYVAILEGDDWWHKDNHIQQHVDFLEKHSKYSMSFNMISHYEEQENRFNINKWRYGRRNYISFSMKDIIVKGNQIGNLSACVFRGRYIKNLPVSFFECNFADWEISIWMAQYGKIAYLSESSSMYRVTPKGQWTALDNIERKKSMISSLKNLKPVFKHKYDIWFDEGLYNIENDIVLPQFISWKTKIKLFLHMM